MTISTENGNDDVISPEVGVFTLQSQWCMRAILGLCKNGNSCWKSRQQWRYPVVIHIQNENYCWASHAILRKDTNFWWNRTINVIFCWNYTLLNKPVPTTTYQYSASRRLWQTSMMSCASAEPMVWVDASVINSRSVTQRQAPHHATEHCNLALILAGFHHFVRVFVSRLCSGTLPPLTNHELTTKCGQILMVGRSRSARKFCCKTIMKTGKWAEN